jgi:hypothetical protein
VSTSLREKSKQHHVTLSRQHEQTSCKQARFLENPPQDHVDLWLFFISASLLALLVLDYVTPFSSTCDRQLQPAFCQRRRDGTSQDNPKPCDSSANKFSGRYSDSASFVWWFCVIPHKLSALSLSIYLPFFVFLLSLPRIFPSEWSGRYSTR